MSDSRFEYLLNQVGRARTLRACLHLVEPLREAYNQRLGVANGKHLLSTARAMPRARVGGRCFLFGGDWAADDDNGHKRIERTLQRWFTSTKMRETSGHIAAPIHSFIRERFVELGFSARETRVLFRCDLQE
jgi:hypothetical protein